MDLIERQAAIDAMANTLWHYPNECYRNLNEYEFAKGLSELGLKSVPSAQPYTEAEIQKMQDLEQAELDKAFELGKLDAESQWIPCKTALPEKGQYVLCQCRVGIMDVLHLTDDNGWYKDSTHIYMHGFVLAWMPLPEPYREEGEE